MAMARAVACALAVGMLAACGPRGWHSCGQNVAHGLGAVDAMVVTNSTEALIQNYAAGFRHFELDVSLTSDGEPAFVHDWENQVGTGIEARLSAAEWGTAKLAGALAPLPMAVLWEKMMRWKDVYVILDVKEDFEATIDGLAATAPDEVEDRLVVQVFAPEQASIVRGYFPRSRILLTLYRSRLSDLRVFEAVGRYALDGVTMHESRYSAELVEALHAVGREAFVHTVNDPVRATMLVSAGVSGLYTDSLPPVMECPR